MDNLDEISKLEYLSLVSKITSELLNHTGINDKTLAEFVIHLHEQNRSLSAFKKALTDAGADFPESFVANLDRLIQKMNPKYKNKGKEPDSSVNGDTTNNYNLDEKARLFPGLALPDDPEA
ncbi:6047_t:CDS:2, partial [Dentiscutata erythropus]